MSHEGFIWVSLRAPSCPCILPDAIQDRGDVIEVSRGLSSGGKAERARGPVLSIGSLSQRVASRSLFCHVAENPRP